MTCKRWRTQIRRWRIDLKISEVVVGELTRWRNDRNSKLSYTRDKFESMLVLNLNNIFSLVFNVTAKALISFHRKIIE